MLLLELMLTNARIDPPRTRPAIQSRRYKLNLLNTVPPIAPLSAGELVIGPRGDGLLHGHLRGVQRPHLLGRGQERGVDQPLGGPRNRRASCTYRTIGCLYLSELYRRLLNYMLLW